MERVYRDVCLRAEKAARHEGRGGASYVDLVKAALRALPDRCCAARSGNTHFNEL